MSGNPLEKYNNFNSRASSSISTGSQAQAAVQPKYNHSPAPKPNYEKLRLVWSNDNPRPPAKKGTLKRIPLAARVNPYIFLGAAIGAGVGSLMDDDDVSSVLGEDYVEPTPEESADRLTREIQQYDPNFTFEHPKDEMGVQYLAQYLNYEQTKYLDIHKDGCKTSFDLDLYNKTVRDQDAKVEIEQMIYGSAITNSAETQEIIKKAAYEDYKANGGTLSYDDWVVGVWNKGAGGGRPKAVLEDITTGPHGPDRPISEVVARARKIDPHTNAMVPQGRWKTRQAGELAAAKVDTSKMQVGRAYSVDIGKSDGEIIRGYNTYPPKNNPNFEDLFMREPANKAVVILKKNGEIHTFPIGPEHKAYNRPAPLMNK